MRISMFFRLAALLLPLASVQGQGVWFRGVGDLPGDRYYSSADSVSADGRVIVGSSQSWPGFAGLQAFRWTLDDGMVGIGELPGGVQGSQASRGSADGLYATGGSNTSAGYETFLWSQGTGMVSLGDLPGGVVASNGAGVSASGAVVVGRGTVENNWTQAFRWTPTTGMVGLGYLPDLPGRQRGSIAVDVSADGNRVVGQSTSAIGLEAFLWTPDTGMVGLGALPGPVRMDAAHAISNNGRFIVGYGSSANGTEAFLWSAEGGTIGLGDFPGGAFVSHAYGVSDDGTVVVGEGYNIEWGNEAFIWRPGVGMRRVADVLKDLGIDTDELGWDLRAARDVSADGLTIVGSGYNPNGDAEGWVVRLPAPGAIVVGAGALVVFGGRRRRA